MFFNIYGENAGWQLLGWLLVFTGLVVANEIARRTKIGGIALFVALPLGLTAYFIAIYASAASGAEWALNNDTYVYMTSWFHYAKLYAATIGCVGFMIIKYHWGKLGKVNWFKVYPFAIVAINILIAVASDFESAIKAFKVTGDLSGAWWLSSENVFIYGGWWNVLNGLAGIINIFCMTGWFNVYSSKDHKDMIWADMTWVYIIAYDVWNFQYTYLNLPTHSWYCGLALLLAPTFANALWNKGGWIQNRANTLALWCMFAQVFPLFQDGKDSRFATVASVYGDGATIKEATAMVGTFGSDKAEEALALVNSTLTPNPKMYGVISVLSIMINVVALAFIIKRSKAQKKNPYTNDIFSDQKDYIEASERIAEGEIPTTAA